MIGVRDGAIVSRRTCAIYDAASPAEVGHNIDLEGEQLLGRALVDDQNGERMVLGSDRGFGLFIFRYTG